MKDLVKKPKVEEELQQLNDKLYDDYSIEELEQRLEFAPWICGAYVEPVCPTLQCGVDNVAE